MAKTIKKILIDKINAAVTAINNLNYASFIDALVELGEHLQSVENIQNALSPTLEARRSANQEKQILQEERKSYRDAMKKLKPKNKKNDDAESKLDPAIIIREYNNQAAITVRAIEAKYTVIRKAITSLKLQSIKDDKGNPAIFKISDHRPFATFIQVWKDNYLQSVDVQKGQLRAKSGLNKSTRHAINLALIALDSVAVSPGHATHIENSQQIREHYDEPARAALSNYMSTGQKLLSSFGKFLSSFVAFASGLMTGVALISTLGTTWPILLGASIIFAAGTYVNWKAFSAVIPSFLLSIAGKDKPFAGFTEYFNKYGELKQLSTGRKLLLTVALFLSSAVGVTFAALTYSSVVGLSAVPAFAFLSVGAAAAILPPVGIALAAITAFGMIALMSRAFIAMLQTDDLKKSFLRPFSTVAKVFQKEAEANNGKSDVRLKIEKSITYGVLALVSIAGLVGLGLFSYTCSLSVAEFLTKMLSVGPAIATGVGYAIGMGLAFIGQVPFILEAAALMTAKMAGYFRDGVAIISSSIKGLFQRNPGHNQPIVQEQVLQNELIYKPSFALQLQSFGETSKAGLVKAKDVLIGFVDFCSKIVNAVGNGFLAIPSGVSAWLASLTLGTSTLNSLNFGFSGDVVSDAKAKTAQDKASTYRVKSLLAQPAQRQNQQDVNVDPILNQHYGFNILRKVDNYPDVNGANDNHHQQENGVDHVLHP